MNNNTTNKNVEEKSVDRTIEFSSCKFFDTVKNDIQFFLLLITTYKNKIYNAVICHFFFHFFQLQ